MLNHTAAKTSELNFLVICKVSVEVFAVHDSPNTEKWGLI